MPVTVFELVVPALTWTGELTLLPFVGVQMVTEGFTVLSGHRAHADGTATNTQAPKTARRINRDMARQTLRSGNIAVVLL